MSFISNPPLRHYVVGQSKIINYLSNRNLGPLTRFCRQAIQTPEGYRVSIPGTEQDQKNFQELFLGRLRKLHEFLGAKDEAVRKEFIQSTNLNNIDFGSRWTNFWVHHFPCICFDSWIAKKVEKVTRGLLSKIEQYQQEQREEIVQGTMNEMLMRIEEETQIRLGFEQDPECAQLLQQLPNESSFAEIYGEALLFFKQEALSVDLFKDYLEFAIEAIRCKLRGTHREVVDRFKYVQTRRAFLKDFASDPLIGKLQAKLKEIKTEWTQRDLLVQAYCSACRNRDRFNPFLFREYVIEIIRILGKTDEMSLDDFMRKVEEQQRTILQRYTEKDTFQTAVVPKDRNIQQELEGVANRGQAIRIALDCALRSPILTRAQFKETFLHYLRIIKEVSKIGDSDQLIIDRIRTKQVNSISRAIERKASEHSQRSNSGSGREE